jgi:creatinine amidohydrolase
VLLERHCPHEKDMNENDSESTPTVLRWETLTKERFDRLDRDRCIVLVTCSPLEVHGPHLPLGADALQGEGLARRMLRFLPEPHRDRTFLQLPFIYAATDTLPHPGSLYFRSSTTMRVLEDLGRTLAVQGFRDVLVSNFHGSPRHFLAVEAACDRVSRKHDVRMVSLFSVLIGRLTKGSTELYGVLGDLPGVSPDDFRGDTHGGLVETAQLLALHPEWVGRDYATLPRRTVDLWLQEQGEAPPEIERGRPAGLLTMVKTFHGALRFFRAETYSGTPGKASRELGEQILDRLGREAASVVAEILEGRLPREQWHSPLWSKRFLFVNPLMVRLFDRVLGIREGIA